VQLTEIVLIYEPESHEELSVYCDAIRRQLPAIDLRPAATMAEAMAQTDATVLVAKAQLVTAELVSRLPQLRLVQSLISGVDSLRKVGLGAGVRVAAARGIHGPQMAELAFLHMLALSRGFARMRQNQLADRWEPWPQPLLMDKTAVIVGLGSIAETLAARCRAFGMRVEGVSSGRAQVEGFARIWPRAALPEAAAGADFLIALVPYEPATHHLIGEAVFAAMRPSAFFINIARGGVVDEAALIAALDAGRIAGAGLDVFATEPLPAGHPFWHLPNVIVTPHVGGRSDVYARQVAPLLVENLAQFAGGAPGQLRHQVTL
jgi:D-2-hydroxyacid dehydrogenase (NADP+)